MAFLAEVRLEMIKYILWRGDVEGFGLSLTYEMILFIYIFIYRSDAFMIQIKRKITDKNNADLLY